MSPYKIEAASLEESIEVDVEQGRRQSWVPALTNQVNDFQLDETWLGSRKPTIGRVYSQLRDRDPEAYEPKLVSIGPLHHGKSNLLQMERKKKENLNFIAGQTFFIKTFGILIDEVSSCLHQAREQYKEKIEMSEDKFMEMLVIDGCFVIGVCLRFDPLRLHLFLLKFIGIMLYYGEI